MSDPVLWAVTVQGAHDPQVLAALGSRSIGFGDLFGGGPTSGPLMPALNLRLAFVDATTPEQAERVVTEAIEGLPASIAAGDTRAV
jgi:hypothetical protein